MFLCNHRSWADFMIDHCVTEGRALFMVRLAVLAGFPVVMIPMWAAGNCIMFKRGPIADKEVRTIHKQEYRFNLTSFF